MEFGRKHLFIEKYRLSSAQITKSVSTNSTCLCWNLLIYLKTYSNDETAQLIKNNWGLDHVEIRGISCW